MVSTLFEEQVEAEAESLNEDETWSSLEGLLIVTPAMAGTATETRNKDATEIHPKIFMRILCDSS